MSAISALPSEIVTWLSEQQQLSDIRFMTEYPPIKKAIPLRNAIVVVGLGQVEIEDSFTDDGTGVLVENEYCRLATMKIKLEIHVPFSFGGASCHDVFTNVLDCLSFASDLNIIDSGCSEVYADRDTDALVLPAWINTSADFCPAISSSLSFQSFLNKDLLCGSHVVDSTIHVTQEDKDRWNNPFVFSVYTGTGAAAKNILLGFTPRFVFAWSMQRSFVEPITGTTSYSALAGAAIENYGSMGIEIITNGFKVLLNGAYFYGNCQTALNEPGVSYAFVAFK